MHCKNVFDIIATTPQTTNTGMPIVPFEAVMTYLHSINMTTVTKKSVGQRLVEEAQKEADDAATVMDFANRLTEDMTSIDPEINQVIEDNFWNML